MIEVIVIISLALAWLIMVDHALGGHVVDWLIGMFHGKQCDCKNVLPSGTDIYCVKRKGHFGAHQTYNGREF